MIAMKHVFCIISAEMVKDKTKAHSVREKWPRGWVVTDLPASRVIGKKTVGEAVSKKSGLEVNNGKVAAAKVVPDGLTKAAEGKDMSATEVVKPVQEVAPAAECVEGSATAGHAGEAVASGGTANESATGETTVGASDKPSKEATTSETANGSTTDEPAEKVGSEESIDVSEGEVAKESADGGAAKESEKESTDGETAKESAGGKAIKESAKESTDGEAAKESADGQGINEAARESADSETTKKASKESADGNTAKESIDSEAAKEDGGLAVQVFSGELATEATTGELVTEVAIGEAAAEIPIDEPAAGETAVTETVAGEPAGIAVSEPVAEVPVVVEPESPAVEGVIEMSAAGSRPDASAMEICAVDCPPSIEIDGMTDEMHGVPEAPSVASESITLESESDALFKGSGCGVSNDSEKEVSAVEAEPKESIVAVAEVEVQPEPLLTPVAIAGVTVGDVATELGMDETEVLDAKPGLDEAAGSELVALKSMAVSPAKFVEPQLPEEVATEFESQIGKEGLAEELRSPASTVEYVAEEEDKEPGRRDGDNNEAHWSEAEDRELLQRMASVLPPIDDMPYNERAKIIRWKHVSALQCLMKYSYLIFFLHEGRIWWAHGKGLQNQVESCSETNKADKDYVGIGERGCYADED